MALGCTAGLAAAQAPVSLEQVNPLGYQTLSAADYIRYVPSAEKLAGQFVPAYSGTSALWLRGVLQKLAEQHPGVDWNSQCHFYASPGVLQLMLNGQAVIGISSWPMTYAQREDFGRRFGYPVLEAKVALDALQVLVHPDNPLDSLTVPQLDAIYGTERRAGGMELIRTWDEAGATGWGAGMPIHACGFPPHYGSSLFFQEAVLQDGPWRPDLNILGDVSLDPNDAISEDPQGIAFSNYRPRGEGVKVLSIARQTGEQAYPPLPRHIYGEEYPLTRFFYVYVNAPSVNELPAEIREFLNYLLSYEGQYEVAKTGSLPLDVPMIHRARKRLGLPLSPPAVRP
jgi:phosphate transport system substrate-binding protein